MSRASCPEAHAALECSELGPLPGLPGTWLFLQSPGKQVLGMRHMGHCSEWDIVGRPGSLPTQLAVDFERGPVSRQPRLRSSFMLMGLPLSSCRLFLSLEDSLQSGSSHCLDPVIPSRWLQLPLPPPLSALGSHSIIRLGCVPSSWDFS